jgi:hypothetical protein
MALLEIDPQTRVDTSTLAKVEFKADQSSPLGQRAELLVAREGQLVPAVPGGVDGIALLQKLREIVGDGSGETRWVRVRQSGALGDNEDSYGNLDKIGDVTFAMASDGTVARVKAADGAMIGEVHHPPALQKVRNLTAT